MTTLVAFSTITLSYDCSIASSGNLLLEYQMGRFICKFSNAAGGSIAKNRKKIQKMWQ